MQLNLHITFGKPFYYMQEDTLVLSCNSTTGRKNITYSYFFPKTRISGDFSELSIQEATFLLNDKHRLSLCVPKIGRKKSIWVVAEYDQHTLLNNSRGKYIDAFSALCSHFGYIITQK